jgi:hypothetical protein
VNERDKRRFGEQIEPGGRPKAPGRLELLQRSINSYNHDFPREWDRIGTAAKAQAWLRRKRLVAPGDGITEADAARLRELREALGARDREPGRATGCSGDGGHPQDLRRSSADRSPRGATASPASTASTCRSSSRSARSTCAPGTTRGWAGRGSRGALLVLRADAPTAVIARSTIDAIAARRR